MAENENPLFLKVVIMIFAVVALVYGLFFFLVPDFLVNMSGGEPVFHGWLRWAGGICVALGGCECLVYCSTSNSAVGYFWSLLVEQTKCQGHIILQTGIEY
jgi:hypothetical protein